MKAETLHAVVADLRAIAQAASRIASRCEEILADATDSGAFPPDLLDGLKKRTRGRKSMGDEEREQVKIRMKKYWAAWRAAKGESVE